MLSTTIENKNDPTHQTFKTDAYLTISTWAFYTFIQTDTDKSMPLAHSKKKYYQIQYKTIHIKFTDHLKQEKKEGKTKCIASTLLHILCILGYVYFTIEKMLSFSIVHKSQKDAFARLAYDDNDVDAHTYSIRPCVLFFPHSHL